MYIYIYKQKYCELNFERLAYLQLRTVALDHIPKHFRTHTFSVANAGYMVRGLLPQDVMLR